MSAQWLVLLVGGVVLAVPLVRLAAGSAVPVPAPLATDFSPAQQARCAAYARPARRLALARLAVSSAWVLGMGLTPWGAWWVRTVAGPFGGGTAAALLLGVGSLAIAGRLLTLPLAGAGYRLRRRVGLATDSRRAWALDLLKATVLSLVLLLAAAAGLLALATRAPQQWWWLAALLAALLVVAGSLLLPVLIEPLFSRFAPLPAGPERADLLELARLAGLRVADVLVADASRRTTAFNAYVSGLGPTRRVVVYDTLLAGAGFEQTRLVVAHELGHVARRDAAWGTAVGAAGAALATVALSIALSWPWLLARAGTDQVAAATTIPLVLALATLGGLLTAPLPAALSRRVEARADRYALDLAGRTGEPAEVASAYAAMHRDLAVAARADLVPARWSYLVFASHPSAPERIAAARAWAAGRGAEVPGLTGAG